MTLKLTEKGYKDYIRWKPEISMWFAQTLELVKLRCRQVMAGAIDPDNFPQLYRIHTESEVQDHLCKQFIKHYRGNHSECWKFCYFKENTTNGWKFGGNHLLHTTDDFVEKFSKVSSNLFKLAEGQKQVTCISGSPVEALHNARLSHTNKRTDFHQTYTPRVKLTTIRMNEGHLAAIEVLIKAAGEAASLSVEDYFNLQISSAKSVQSMVYNHQHADEQAKRHAKIAEDRYNSIVNVDLGQTFVQYKEVQIQECYIP
ncbi:hypothetical protein HDU80_002832, partial [Chytriomyces hyalinus]